MTATRCPTCDREGCRVPIGYDPAVTGIGDVDFAAVRDCYANAVDWRARALAAEADAARWRKVEPLIERLANLDRDNPTSDLFDIRRDLMTAPVAPPAPRRPVAGWVGTADRMVLRVGAMRAVAIGTKPPWRDVTRHINARHEAPFSVVDEGGAPTLEAAQLAAEDALRAVLVDAAAALGLRVVPS
jgi:hypothetical protein